MRFLKRHKILSVFLAVLLLCVLLFFLKVFGFLNPPLTYDYHIGANSIDRYSDTPYYYYVTIKESPTSEYRTIHLDKETADALSAVVRGIEGQRLSLFTSRDTQESIFIAWGKLSFYPNCYSNNYYDLNYTCKNYDQVYAALKEIVLSIEEEPPPSPEETGADENP